MNAFSSSIPLRINITSVRIEDDPMVSRTNLSTSPKPSKQLKLLLQSRKPKLLEYNLLSQATSTRLIIHKKASVATKQEDNNNNNSNSPSLLSTLLNMLEDIINKYVDPIKRASCDPRIVLSRNFAPVGVELPPTECEIEEGVLPSCLDGAYIRNGPNPQFYPRGPYHLFDGDGMLHCIRIHNNKATLCSRFVRTYKYTVEHDAGCNVVPNVFSGVNGFLGFVARATLAATRVAAGQYNPINGVGLANTSLAFFGNKLYALGESDLPYEVKLTSNGDVQTVGRHDFDGKVIFSLTAHPKIDHDTGETFAYRYGPVPPFLSYFRFDRKGDVTAEVPIFTLTRPSFIHDFAVTKKYAVFPDIQIVMDFASMILRGGSLLGWDPKKMSRIGIIPRYADDEKSIRWFDVPNLNVVHVINAWDEVDEDGNEAIVMVAPNILSAEHTLQPMDLVHSSVEKVRIVLDTGVVTRQSLSARNLDFGVVNPAYAGKKNRYVYAAVGNPQPNVTGVVKLDVSLTGDRLDECVVGSRVFEPGCYGGEPFFVASDPEDVNAHEDDGVASAPGKVLMTGGYLVLERPNAGLVLSTNARFYAIVKPIHNDDIPQSWAWSWMDVKLTAPQLSRETMYKMSFKNYILQCVSSSDGRNPFVEQALQYVVATAFAKVDKDNKDAVEKLLKRGLDITIMGANEFYSYRDQLAARGLALAPESLTALPPFSSITFNTDDNNAGNIKPEVAKTGLGSSAAMTTAVVAALLHYLGIVNLSGLTSLHHGGSISNKDLDLVHMIAQTSHCMAQGKVGSGFDVSCAVYGSQRYVRFSPEVLSSAQVAGIGSLLGEVIVDVLEGNWNHEITKFSLPPHMTLILGEPGSGGSSTPSMVGAVKKWQKSEPEKSLCTVKKLSEANSLLEKQLNQLCQLADQLKEAYESVIGRCSKQTSEKWMEQSAGPSEEAVVKALLAARNAMLDIRCHMRHMGEAAGVPIEPDTQTSLLDATMDMEGVLLAGIPGAGGYDAVFAITLGDSSSSKVATSWSSHNVLALPVRENPHGVSLESGDPRLHDITVGFSSANIH